MPQLNPDRFELPARAYAYVILPAIVVGASSYLIERFGFPLDHLAEATVQNGHAEAAGRLRALATWLLLACVGIACIGYCAWSASRLGRTTVGRLAALYLVLAAGGVLAVYDGWLEGGQRFMDRRVICAAFALAQAPPRPPDPAPGAAAIGRTATPQPADRAPGAARERLTVKSYGQAKPAADDAGACGSPNPGYELLWGLNQFQKYILVLLIPALILGTISCRALPASPAREDCRFQVDRLKTHLNLTAMALVAGLLFLSALIHWPGFAFEGAAAASYKAHVNAYILYWGVGYSLLIASYYVPIAIDLTQACGRGAGQKPKRQGSAGQGETTPAAELLGLLKTVAALFAPAIAGLLGSIVQI